jgi:hypothetical protein
MMSFFGVGRENPSLQLYGKLPVAKDFLRIGCAEGSGRDLRDWLDRTFGTIRQPSEALVLSEALCFLGQGGKEPLQGCLWPSSDEGELRRFPFTLFVARKLKALASDFESGLREAEGVWRVLAEAREQCLATTDGHHALSEQRGRQIDVGSTERVESPAADFDTWVATLWPEDGLEGLFALVEILRDLGGGGYEGPYRMPLVCDLPLRDQVMAWKALLQVLGALPPDGLPTSFFPLRALVPLSTLSSVLLSRRPLSDDQVRWLIEPVGGGSLGPGDLSLRRDEVPEHLSSPPDARVRLRDSLRAALAPMGLGIGGKWDSGS